MNMQLAQLLRAMIYYDSGDIPRIQHFVKVHDFAATIGVSENLNEETQLILEAAAILHDIGIHPAEAKYGNCNGKAQEELGPNEAHKLLAKADGFTDAQIERICWLIGHHHTYNNVKMADHRILLEADFLVNSFEDKLSIKSIITFRDNGFQPFAKVCNKYYMCKYKTILQMKEVCSTSHTPL